MNWLSMALFTLTKVPFEKLFVKRSDPVKEVEKLEALFRKDTLAGKLLSQPDTKIENRKTDNSVRESNAPEIRSMVTDEETIAYQKRELSKEILLLEKHLQQKCKILNKACDCCSKHLLPIEGLAQEALGMTGDSLYSEVQSWVRSITPVTTTEASASGHYDEQYPQLAVEARALRKRIMGTAEVSALLTPGLSEKVSAELQEILDRAMKKEGGSDGRGTEERV